MNKNGEAWPRVCWLPILALAAAALAGGDLHAGVIDIFAINGNHEPTELLASPPGSAESDALTGKVYAFNETTNVVLGTNLNVDASSSSIPGNYYTGDPIPGGVVPAGTHIDSFLIHFDIAGVPQFPVTAEFRVNTDGPIVGVIYSDALLDASDNILGSISTTYPSGLYDRGTSAAADEGDDHLFIGFPADGPLNSYEMIVQMELQGSVDEVRVLTLVPEPSSVALLLCGVLAWLAACGWRRRRRSCC